ncbi:MAG: hypothetical protein KKG60_03675, partial [Nanoarchaeota archaeon]|nr:hypothetical protein [Nanoarchaeota archaeon]
MLKRGVGGRDVWCRGRRSQSAMEFLMTYGWAILIIAIVLSGLFYFGVFSSKGSVSCTIGDPFFCRDIGIKTNKIIFVLDVPRVAMVEDHKIEVKTEEGWIECPGSSGKDIKRSYSKVWCDLPVEYELEEGKKAEAKLTVYYTKLEARDVRHTIYGSGRAVVEGAISADCNGDYVDSIEVCDGNNFRYYLKDNPLEGEIMDPGENSCAAYYQDSSYGGTISCSLDCGTTYSYDCYKCGDKEINGDEKCDTNNLGGETCQSQGFDDGDLKCSSDCLSFDISGCYNYECGNENENGIGILDPNEECDCGSDGVCTLAELDQKTCGDYDFESGSLECMGAGLENECTLDSSDCYTCGDRQITGSEKCDSDKDGKVIPYCYQIEVVGLPGTYYTKGETSCSVDCLTLTSSDCSFCGNGIPEGLSETSLSWEQCDCGSDGVCSSYELRGKKCTNFVDVYNSFFKDGELGCTSLCTYNTYD